MVIPPNVEQESPQPGSNMLTRVFKAMILNSATYAEVADDNEATIDAAFLILIYILAATIANALNATATWLMIALIIPLALIEWLVFAGLTCVIAERLFHGEGTLPGIYRAMGFSVSPGIFYLLAAIPTVGACISGLLSLYILVANVIAVKAAMKIGIGGTLVSMFLASTVAGILLGCLAVPLILLLGPENLINNLDQFR